MLCTRFARLALVVTANAELNYWRTLMSTLKKEASAKIRESNKPVP